MNCPVITVKQNEFGYFLNITRIIKDKVTIVYGSDRTIANMLNMFIADYRAILLNTDKDCQPVNGLTCFQTDAKAQSACVAVNNVLQEKWQNKTLYFPA